jgi:enediyne biosynthesis protein E5
MEHRSPALDNVTSVTSVTGATAARRRSVGDVLASLRPTDPAQVRIAALRRFATAITILNFVGHRWLGFEQAIAQPLVAVLTCYATELFLETVDAARAARLPAYRAENPDATARERARTMVNFLLPAHITGFALGMLLFIDSRLDLFVVGGIVAISSKYVFRFRTSSAGHRHHKHYFNPSNFGITVLLLLYSRTVSIAPPYQFTESFGTRGDVLLPAFILCLGLFVNTVFTGKIPLIAAWASGFALQAIVRSVLFGDISVRSALSPLTGLALILFTLYMITDPGTTPRSTRGQVAFGLSVAAVYGVLVTAGVSFGIFFALTIVCAVRGLYLTIVNARQERRSDRSADAPEESEAGPVRSNGAEADHAPPRAKEPTGS